MQMSTAVETENGEMIVKRVSVPVGLEELMEGLTKEVLLKKPKDIYAFASEYFARLLSLRESGNYDVAKQFRSVQSVTRQTSKPLLLPKNVKSQPKQVIREKSPPKLTATSKKMSLMRKSKEINEQKENDTNSYRVRKAISCDETITPRKENDKTIREGKLRQRSLSTYNKQNERQKRSNTMTENSIKKECSKSKDGKIEEVSAIIGGSLAAVAVKSRLGKSKESFEKNKIEEIEKQTTALKEDGNKKEFGDITNIDKTKNVLEQNMNVNHDKNGSNKEFVKTNNNNNVTEDEKEKLETCTEKDSSMQNEDKLSKIDEYNIVSEEKNKLEHEKIEEQEENINNKEENDNVVIENSELLDEKNDKETKSCNEIETLNNNIDEKVIQSEISNKTDDITNSIESQIEQNEDKTDIARQDTKVDDCIQYGKNDTDTDVNESSGNKDIDTEKSSENDKSTKDKAIINNSATEGIITNTIDESITGETWTKSEKDGESLEIIENNQLSTEKDTVIPNTLDNISSNKSHNTKVSQNDTNIASNENEIKTIDNSFVEIAKNRSIEDENCDNSLKQHNKIGSISTSEEIDDVQNVKQSKNVDRTLKNEQIEINNSFNSESTQEVGKNNELEDKKEATIKNEDNTRKNEVVENKNKSNNEWNTDTEKTDKVSSQESVPVKDNTNAITENEASFSENESIFSAELESDNNELHTREKVKPRNTDKAAKQSEILNKSNQPSAIADDVIKNDKKRSVLEENKHYDKSNTEKKGNSKQNLREKSPTKKSTEKNDKLPKPKTKNINTRSLSNENLIKNENSKENIKNEKQIRRIKSVDTLIKNKNNSKIISSGLNKLKPSERVSKAEENKEIKEKKENVTTQNAGNESNKSKSVDKSRPKRSISAVDENIDNKSIHKQSSFDISKLRSEIDKVETGTTFKSSYNPYILRQEIKQASKNTDKNQTKNMFTDVTAAIKIQSLWRGFIARKRQITLKDNIQQSKNAELNVRNDNKEKENDIVRAVILIQKMWRGFHVRKIHRKASLFGNVVENNENNSEIIKSIEDYKTGDHKSALKIQSLWRGYQVRKSITNVEKRLRRLNMTDNGNNNKELKDNDILNAATKIQAGVRGYLQRKKIKNSHLGKITEENIGDEETLTENKEKQLVNNEDMKDFKQLDSVEVPKNSPEIPSLTRSDTVEEPECIKVVNNTNLTKDDNNNNDLTSLEREVKEAVHKITTNSPNNQRSSFNIEELKKEIQAASNLDDINTSQSNTVTNNSINTVTNTSITKRNQSDCSINKIVPHTDASNNVNNLNTILIDKKIDPDTINDVYENAPTRPATSDTVITSSGYENNQYDENLVKLQTNTKVENVNVTNNEIAETHANDIVTEKDGKINEEKSKDNDNIHKKFDIEQLKKDLDETNTLLSIIPNVSGAKTVAVNKENAVADNFCSQKINVIANEGNKIKNDVEILSEKSMEQSKSINDNNRQMDESNMKSISDGNDSSLSTDSADSVVTVIPKSESQKNEIIKDTDILKSNFNIEQLKKEVEVAGINNSDHEKNKISNTFNKNSSYDDNSAATKIQSIFRGYRVRRDLPKTMNEKRNKRQLFDIKEENTEVKDAEIKNDKFSENLTELENKKESISVNNIENNCDNKESIENLNTIEDNGRNIKVESEIIDEKATKQENKLIKLVESPKYISSNGKLITNVTLPAHNTEKNEITDKKTTNVDDTKICLNCENDKLSLDKKTEEKEKLLETDQNTKPEPGNDKEIIKVVKSPEDINKNQPKTCEDVLINEENNLNVNDKIENSDNNTKIGLNNENDKLFLDGKTNDEKKLMEQEKNTKHEPENDKKNVEVVKSSENINKNQQKTCEDVLINEESNLNLNDKIENSGTNTKIGLKNENDKLFLDGKTNDEKKLMEQEKNKKHEPENDKKNVEVVKSSENINKNQQKTCEDVILNEENNLNANDENENSDNNTKIGLNNENDKLFLDGKTNDEIKIMEPEKNKKHELENDKKNVEMVKSSENINKNQQKMCEDVVFNEENNLNANDKNENSDKNTKIGLNNENDKLVLDKKTNDEKKLKEQEKNTKHEPENDKKNVEVVKSSENINKNQQKTCEDVVFNEENNLNANDENENSDNNTKTGLNNENDKLFLDGKTNDEIKLMESEKNKTHEPENDKKNVEVVKSSENINKNQQKMCEDVVFNEENNLNANDKNENSDKNTKIGLNNENDKLVLDGKTNDEKKLMEQEKNTKHEPENDKKNVEVVKSSEDINKNQLEMCTDVTILNKQNNLNNENGKLLDGKASENKRNAGENIKNDELLADNSEEKTGIQSKNQNLEDNIDDNSKNENNIKENSKTVDLIKDENTIKVDAVEKNNASECKNNATLVNTELLDQQRSEINININKNAASLESTTEESTNRRNKEKNQSLVDNIEDNFQNVNNQKENLDTETIIKDENTIKVGIVEKSNTSEEKNNANAELLDKKENEININAVPLESTTEESTNKESKFQLLHTGEFHDTVVIPLPLSQISNNPNNHQESRTVSRTSDFHEERMDNGTQTVVNTGELADTALPLAVQLNEAAPAGTEIVVTSPSSSALEKSVVTTTDDDDDDDDQVAQASNKDALQHFECGLPDNSTISTVSTMETEKRNNTTSETSSNGTKNMEIEAATKIQAGFRGYQVRKQLKMKNSSNENSNQKRTNRRKSGTKLTPEPAPKTKPLSEPSVDLEEQSAVKIQAGIRGFLVRRRQKKQKNTES